MLPKAISQFHQQFPEVGVTIVERPHYLDIENCLREGRADIGTTYLPTKDEFEAWNILNDEYIVLFPPHAEINRQITWEDLAKYQQIMLPALPCGGILHEHLKLVAPFLNTVSDIQEDSTVVSMVNQGLATAILPRLAALPIPQNVRVCSLPSPLKRVIGIAISSNTLHIPAVFTFLEMLKQFDFQTLAESTV